MSHKTTLLGAAASIVLLASGMGVANAGSFSGWYLGIEAGANWVQDYDAEFNRGPTGGAVTFTNNHNHEFETGWAGIATLGYGFGNHLRAELEGGYRHNSFDTIQFTFGIPASSSPDGDLSEWTIMANVIYDLMLTERLGLSFGVGAGADNARLDLRPQPPASTVVFDDDDWNFAYQGIVGLSYELGSRSQLVLNYRYLRVSEPEWNDVAGGPDFIRLNADDLSKHTVTIGLRYDLWPDEEEPMAAVSAPPPDLPPAPPAQSFMIFFGFNKCNITPEADNVLSQAADAARQMGSATVQIVGHTDTVGSDRYNKKLSVCRAHAAKSNLVGKGVAENSIATSGKGESELLVQTADGVKEPQNRRATVDLQ
jgi:OOP family OmpA-OmpF porin